MTGVATTIASRVAQSVRPALAAPIRRIRPGLREYHRHLLATERLFLLWEKEVQSVRPGHPFEKRAQVHAHEREHCAALLAPGRRRGENERERK
jgi:hypothetical protein